MATDTDIRLRSRLDSNQRDREQMCQAILALNPKYTDVRPRHPSGGPDGGRDIEAVTDRDVRVFGAVGFANGANDSDEQKKKFRKKFSDDLARALEADSQLKGFVFFTNLHFTIGEQDELKEEASKAGIEHFDILDRERLRIELDSAAGYFIRFQHLGIPLSEAEQASFLARYGVEIQSVVSTGFARVERVLNRLLFLSESNDVLDTLYVNFKLDRECTSDELGHFRAFISLHLRAVTLGIISIVFGVADKADRFRDAGERRDLAAGLAGGFGTGQWEQHTPEVEELRTDTEATDEGKDEERYVAAGWGSHAGRAATSVLTARYRHDDSLIRFRPRLRLKDLDDCSFLPFVSASLASKIEQIEVFANGYKLATISRSDFKIDPSKFDWEVPGENEFDEQELSDSWVRLRPSPGYSAFHIRFAELTPKRLFDHEDIA